MLNFLCPLLVKYKKSRREGPFTVVCVCLINISGENWDPHCPKSIL